MRFTLMSMALKSIAGIPFVNMILLIVTVWSQYTELSHRSLALGREKQWLGTIKLGRYGDIDALDCAEIAGVIADWKGCVKVPSKSTKTYLLHFSQKIYFPCILLYCIFSNKVVLLPTTHNLKL